MAYRKLQCRGQSEHRKYNINLPKELIENLAGWTPNVPYEVLWIPDGKDFKHKGGFFVIRRPKNVWG